MTSPGDDGEWIANQGLVIRLGSLENGLRQALTEFEAASTPLERRAAIRRSLSAVVDFIGSFGPVVLAAPVIEIVESLLTLDRGGRPTIFTPAPVGNRPTEALSREHIKAYTAATFDRMLSSGISRDDAATRVARVLDRRGYRLDGRRGAPTAKTVIEWRDQYTGHSGSDVGAAAFRRLRPSLDQRSGEDALMRLDKFLATVIPKNPPS